MSDSGAAVAVPAAASRCTHCGSQLAGRYCHDCGQDTVPADTAWRSWVDQWHKLLRTLDALILRPGLLTQEHLCGGRVRYIAPLTLYLNTVALFFVFSTLVDFRLSTFFDRSTPGFLHDLVAHRATAEHIGEALFMERADRRFQTVYTICLSVISVAGYALVARLLFARRWKGWRGPLTLALHFMAFVFIVYMPLTAGAFALLRRDPVYARLGNLVFAGGVLIVCTWFTLAIRRLFGDGWPRAAGKGLVITLAGLPINTLMWNVAIVTTLAVT
jgi:Protein of unknown function (DUF3667)